jgi:ATP-dependent RNA helicase DeaD
MTEFDGVISAFSQALTKRGYKSLTEVQTAVLAPELSEEDLVVSAQTGSGKTVAFGLAIAPTLLDGAEKFTKVNIPLALVIAPTRELALQVTRELEWLYAPSGGSVASCVGGMDMRSERRALSRGPHIVVGTPGRLKDHIERGSFDTSGLKAVVLDEADEMLDMGFRDELEYILDTTPRDRRTLMFSATVPKAIASLAKRYQHDAQRITTKEEQNQHIDIEYQALTIAPNDRENAIINLLRYHEAKNAIIFCATRAEVNHLTSRLTNRGFSVVALSGELSQSERSNAMQALRDGRAKVCVATDVASRGLDLPGLALVIHADMPKNRDILLHRSGRTGRAGSKGVSALIVPHNWSLRAERLLQNAKIKATWRKPPSIKEILDRDRERFLTSPALSDPIQENEKASIDDLMTRYAPEQIAAALMRLNNTQKPAPEELLDAAPLASPRESFKDSAWVELSVGRDMEAEARWILPMICGAGHITKKNVGAIKIHPDKTYIELTSDCVKDFLEAIGPKGVVEKNITVTLFEGTPPASKGDFDGPRRSKKKYNDRGPRKKRNDGGGKADFKKKRDHYKPRDDKPSEGGKPKGGKPKDGFKKKSEGGKKKKRKNVD